MPPKLPPPQAKSKSANALYSQMVAKNHVPRGVAADVLYWAKREQIDPIYALSVMLAESHANPKIHDSSAGAIGVFQVMPGIHKIPWGNGGTADEKWLRNYSNNIRLGMYLLASAVHQVGYGKAYSGVKGVSYNYGGGTPYQKYAPKGYIYGSTGGGATTAPETAAANTAAGQQAKGQNPYLQGQLFLDKWHNEIDPIWESYTGKRASRAQAAAVIANGWSSYHLEVQLSKSKSFAGSPIWQSKAPGYRDVYQQIYGSNAKPSDKLLAYGIIHNLDGQGFANIIRKQKNYTNSNEFKTNASQFEDIYRKIYGTPDQTGVVTIKRAVLNGWSQDQFAKYLRGQPEYSKSQEWGSAVNGLLDTLGMVTGQGVVMTPGQETGAPVSPGNKAPGPDKRVPGQAGLGVQGPQYKVGLNG